MTVTPAALSRPQTGKDSAPYVPPGDYRGRLDDFDYIEEEWFATGEAEGRSYTTTVFVRRPRDRARFSGTVVVEPLHAMGAPPIWLYTSDYIMRSGHGWAVISSQKTALDAHVKSFDPRRYESIAIEADPPPPDAPEVDALNLPVGDPARMAAFFAEMQRQNHASNTILAQVGAALAASGGPFEGWDVAHVILTGHSQTGGVVTDYIRNAHDSQRLGDGSPVYHGYFPSGSPGEPFGAYDVPIVQVVSEGDISDPNRPGREGRKYRRDDSDEPGDRFRLYELAGVPHMGTRYPPYNNPAQWQQVATAGKVPTDVVMNSLPHGELFNMALHYLVQWVTEGVAPPRAERIEVGADGFFAQDVHGNSRGGVRCVEMDVPRARYFANPKNDDGTPAFGVVGTEEPFAHEQLQQLYPDHSEYVERFNRRLDELIGQGWLLAEDADDLRNEAEKADVPEPDRNRSRNDTRSESAYVAYPGAKPTTDGRADVATQSLALQLRAKRSEMMISELEAVALRLFEARGFGDVTVEDIASEAHISVRTFYRYFPGKEDVLQLHIDRRSEALREALSDRPDDEPPLHSLRLALEVAVSAEDTALVRRWIAVVAATPSVLRGVLGGIQLKGHRVMAEFFGARLGLPSDALVPTMLAAAAGGVIQASQTHWYFHGGDLATAFSEGLDVLERGIGTDPTTWSAGNGVVE